MVGFLVASHNLY